MQLDPATIAAIGTGIGAAIGALFTSLKTARTARQTEVVTQHVKSEIDGPGDQPSLREMLRAGNEASFNQYSSLHTDIIHLTDRVTNIEKGKGETIIATTLGAIHDHYINLSGEMKRARLNIHQLAQVAQVKLFTQEEAEAHEVKTKAEQK
jgi:MFS superfamily sulfate permease-like transporter